MAGSVDLGSHPLGWQPAGIGDDSVGTFCEQARQDCLLAQGKAGQERRISERCLENSTGGRIGPVALEGFEGALGAGRIEGPGRVSRLKR